MMVLAILLSAAALQARCPTPSSWGATPAADPNAGNIIRTERGQLTWNHLPVGDVALDMYLTREGQTEGRIPLVVDVGSVDCAALAVIAVKARNAGVSCTGSTCIAAVVPVTPTLPRVWVRDRR